MKVIFDTDNTFGLPFKEIDDGLTLLATGPLTNALAASSLDSHFFSNLNHIICMGGYLNPLRIGWRNLPELNFSSDPEACYAVLNADTKVTILNAHICLEAPFTISDLQRIHFWPVEIRRIVKNWLIVFGLYAGVLEFYLWDLVPAVYLFEPHLFENNTVFIDSSVANLERGILTISTGELGRPISMPKHIHDIGGLMHAVLTAWEKPLHNADFIRSFNKSTKNTTISRCTPL